MTDQTASGRGPAAVDAEHGLGIDTLSGAKNDSDSVPTVNSGSVHVWMAPRDCDPDKLIRLNLRTHQGQRSMCDRVPRPDTSMDGPDL